MGSKALNVGDVLRASFLGSEAGTPYLRGGASVEGERGKSAFPVLNRLEYTLLNLGP